MKFDDERKPTLPESIPVGKGLTKTTKKKGIPLPRVSPESIDKVRRQILDVVSTNMPAVRAVLRRDP